LNKTKKEKQEGGRVYAWTMVLTNLRIKAREFVALLIFEGNLTEMILSK